MSEDPRDAGVDLGEFLEFYLLDSQEQIERLGTGLLQLEKEGNNITLINDLFRSAHSLKGASGTMGFTPIVALTHAAEDLLDRLRQGKTEVTMEIIDILLAVTDRVKMMLEQVKQNQEITVEFVDLTESLKRLTEGAPKDGTAAAAEGEAKEEDPALKDVPVVDFALTAAEKAEVANALETGHGVFQVEIAFDSKAVMRAVRAVMAVQRAESIGTVVKSAPGMEEIEAENCAKFSLLLICDEAAGEIQEELMNVSELSGVEVHFYADPLAPGKSPGEAVGAAKRETLLQAEPAVKTDSQPAAVMAATTAPDAAKGNSSVQTIRVDTVRMDNLINMAGEMVITRTRLVQNGLDLKDAHPDDHLVSQLNETNMYLGRLMNDLQEGIMRLRMVPIGTVFSRFPRLVRDLARKTGKEITLELRGEETELDKTVVEVIGDPMMHLIRNSVDHGIEMPEERQLTDKPKIGTILLDAYHEGNHIVILISDDGQGLSLEKIKAKALEKGLISEREELSDRDVGNLIFLPGFSTADQVTDISGRGVGMDVVKKALSNLGGSIDIDTKRGKGTTFTIRLPLTLAIIQALLVNVGEEVYAVPLSSVLETLLVERKDIKSVGGLPMIQLRGKTLPMISLHKKFDIPTRQEKADPLCVVVVGLGEKAFGLIVDELRGQQEVVIKSLGEHLNNLPGIAGATILGDGKVTLILDVGALVQEIMIERKNRS
ncbi:MAG: chemotaxis protein CheA [Peptococcaceae bacterium]|jgi:two-component system chemotaxis sensor kinase CheA|nr:chemotaxis protein CheA [Peptococcaceae bacterium]